MAWLLGVAQVGPVLHGRFYSVSHQHLMHEHLDKISGCIMLDALQLAGAMSHVG